MLVSFVIRVAAAALSAERLVGDVEHVASGARGTFRDAQELTAWCSSIAAATDVAVVPPPRLDDAGSASSTTVASPGDPT